MTCPPPPPATARLELWGGIECTLSRVRDAWFDQTRLSGHHTRLDDLDRFADLGMTAIRYPVLWERTAPDTPDARDFGWADARLARLRALGIRPIVGLVHHGSGPKYTSLLDDAGFATGLAAHAAAVAQRYPWVTDYTPVNEPLTTARFAALYGIWHPHTRDEGACWRALLNEADATRLAMRAVRAVNPAARLIATDDLGRCFGTPEAAAEVAFENERRWLGWDLLFGRVVPGHPLWERLARHGFADRLRVIADDPCPPDVVGINHYVTSDRFLDHRVDGDPGLPAADHVRPLISHNAVRRVPDLLPTIDVLLGEAWERYGTTLAVTEAHLGCTREEQMRWFARIWDGAGRARRAGIDVVAVTAWSLLGAHGWDALASGGGRYEPGVFDTRAPAPRPTGMVPLLKALAQGAEPPRAGLLAQPGWWERPHLAVAADAAPVLVTGRSGTLGQALARACTARGLAHVVTGRETLALTDPGTIDAALDRFRPWAVINTAGIVDIDRAEGDAAGTIAVNTDGPARLAAACAARGIAFVTVSTDQVFDGTKGAAYVERDAVAPLNVYGRSKAEAERRVLAAMPDALVVRTAAFFSPHDPHNFAVHVVDALRRGECVRAAADSIVSPTYVPDLVDALLDLLCDGAGGLWHLATPGAVSWAAFARALAVAAGRDAGLVDAVPGATLGWTAPRPAAVALASERSWTMPPLADAIGRFAADYGQRLDQPRRTTSPAIQPASSARATANTP